jgi:nitroreductase
MMETRKAIEGRVSIRKFEDRPLSKECIEKLVDAGRLAPRARDIQPWEFVAVTDKATLTELGRIADTGNFIREAACCIAVFCRGTKYYLEDGSAATENILLAVADMNLGACWVAGDKKPYAEEVAKLLGVPGHVKLVSLIPVGWPAEHPEGVRRRTLEEVLHWEKYQESKML